MDFISATFIVFIVLLAGIYFLVPDKVKWFVLLAGSYIFYMASSAKLLAFLIFTTAVTFVGGLLLEHINHRLEVHLKEHRGELGREEKKVYKNQAAKKKRCIVAVTVLINLGSLIFLKYFNFIGGNLNILLAHFGIGSPIPELNLLLPLGISFYTLQSIGYIVDLYRGKYQPDKNFFKFSLFMSFFPQIVQGPIPRYDQLAYQLYEPHKFEYTRVAQGAQLVLWGFMKKLILADRLAVAVNVVFDSPDPYEGFILFFAAAGYGLQVYADFSGGMDIARGMAQILGIDFVLNFERPYFATSISDFWRRWHITLGSWMRDYVFYPFHCQRLLQRLENVQEKFLGIILAKKCQCSYLCLLYSC